MTRHPDRVSWLRTPRFTAPFGGRVRWSVERVERDATSGAVLSREGCGHRHRTEAAAERCERDLRRFEREHIG